MAITQVSPTDIINLIRSTLELPYPNDVLDDTVISCNVRRAAGFLCPCSSGTLVSSMMNSLSGLSINDGELRSRIEDCIEKLIVWGDLLELNDVATNDLNAKGTWLFAATPSFIVRPNGNIFISGITPDENSPLSSFSERIKYEGCKRIIEQKLGEELDKILEEFGLIHTSEKLWFKLPRLVSASQHLEDINLQLSRLDYGGDIPEILLLDSDRPVNYYKGRWTVPSSQTGRFVAKRPQIYGGHTWCYVEMEKGQTKKVLDIPLKSGGIHQRSCDGAWQLQMAIDSVRKKPQEYLLRDAEGGKVFDFFSPIPLWAERRLISIGNFINYQRSLFSYFIPGIEFEEEEKFLRDYLWLIRKRDNE